MGRTTCAFTGHQSSRFPWGYNEADKDCIVLKEILTSEIIRLTDIGVTQFLSGMMEGVDRWAATIVLALREKTLCLNCTAFCHAKHRQTNGPQPQKTYIALSWNRQILLFTSAEITTKDV